MSLQKEQYLVALTLRGEFISIDERFAELSCFDKICRGNSGWTSHSENDVLPQWPHIYWKGEG